MCHPAADYVWGPFVLVKMKKRGADLARTYRQAFDCWTRLAPGRRQPRSGDIDGEYMDFSCSGYLSVAPIG